MNSAQQIIGSCVRLLREQKRMTLEQLALQAGISYQYLSGIETGKENFTISVLESLSTAFDLPVNVLTAMAYQELGALEAPRLQSAHFRPEVPRPDLLTLEQIEAAANRTQLILHRINHHLMLETAKPLSAFIQGNNFSGIVSNMLCHALDAISPYKHNSHSNYPDLRCPGANAERGEGLEVKATINVGKGGESHNGHGGWHLIACYEFNARGDIVFVHLMFAMLNGHLSNDPDWKYQKSLVKASTGSQRTETYITTLKGTTKLRDGAVYLDSAKVSYNRWRQDRGGEPTPPWSPFTLLVKKPEPKRKKKS